jgi:hypothetical protein
MEFGILGPLEVAEGSRLGAAAADAAVGALGPEAFTGALEQGRRMSVEEAAGYALSAATAG